MINKNTKIALKLIFLTILVSIFFSGCVCLTCAGNGSCYGTGKCVGHGICKSGFGKCIRPTTSIENIDKAIEDISYTCDGFGSCDGTISCDGNITKDNNNISYCEGKMVCKNGSGTCNGDGYCTAGIGTCENSLYANCTGLGTCYGVGLCAGQPGMTINTDVSNKNSLINHQIFGIQK